MPTDARLPGVARGRRAATVPKGRTGNKNFMVKDPDGHNVEIVEYQPDSWTAQGRRPDTCPRRVSRNTRCTSASSSGASRRRKFYNGILGFEEFWRGSAANSQTLSWVNMRVPDGTDYLEFMLHDDNPAPDGEAPRITSAWSCPTSTRRSRRSSRAGKRASYTRPVRSARASTASAR